MSLSSFVPVSHEAALSSIAAGYEFGSVYPLRDFKCLDYIFDHGLEGEIVEAIKDRDTDLKVMLVDQGLAKGLYLVSRAGKTGLFHAQGHVRTEVLAERYDVILSYAVADYELAQAHASSLRKMGLSVYFYEIGDNTANEHWWLSFKEAMVRGATFVPLITGQFLSGQGASAEFEEAVASAHFSHEDHPYFPVVPWFESEAEHRSQSFQKLSNVPTPIGAAPEEFAVFLKAISDGSVTTYFDADPVIAVMRHENSIEFPEFGSTAQILSTGALAFTGPSWLRRPYEQSRQSFEFWEESGLGGDGYIKTRTWAKSTIDDMDFVNVIASYTGIYLTSGDGPGTLDDLADALWRSRNLRDAYVFYRRYYELYTGGPREISKDEFSNMQANRLNGHISKESRIQFAERVPALQRFEETVDEGSFDAVVTYWSKMYRPDRKVANRLTNDQNKPGMYADPETPHSEFDNFGKRDLASDIHSLGLSSETQDDLVAALRYQLIAFDLKPDDRDYRNSLDRVALAYIKFRD